MFKSRGEKLIIATRANDVETVARLIKRGANVGFEGEERMTALHWAARDGQTAILKLLIAAGADIEAQNRFSASPLLMAAAGNHTQEAVLLIDAGANVNMPQYQYNYPIHFAAKNGNYEMAKALVAAGARVDVETNNGLTPLQLALDNKKVKLAEFLIEHGARLKPADKKMRAKAADLGIEALAVTGTADAPLPATAPAASTAKPAGAGWHKLDDSKIALIEELPQLSRKLTTLFNFATRERLVITQNLETRQESVASPESFDVVPVAVLEKALQEFTAQGGVADESVLRGGSKLKFGR